MPLGDHPEALGPQKRTYRKCHCMDSSAASEFLLQLWQGAGEQSCSCSGRYYFINHSQIFQCFFFLQSFCEPTKSIRNRIRASPWQQGSACPAVGQSPRSMKEVCQQPWSFRLQGRPHRGFPGGHQSHEKRKTRIFVQIPQ